MDWSPFNVVQLARQRRRRPQVHPAKPHREAARQFGIDRKAVSKILKHSVPPGYRRENPPARPKLDLFVGIIDQILDEDNSRIKKQRHPASHPTPFRRLPSRAA
jgi:hypothetical protein